MSGLREKASVEVRDQRSCVGQVVPEVALRTGRRRRTLAELYEEGVLALHLHIAATHGRQGSDSQKLCARLQALTSFDERSVADSLGGRVEGDDAQELVRIIGRGV